MYVIVETISAVRKRVVGEIIPTGAENSQTPEQTDENNYRAANAFDLDLNAKSWSLPEVPAGTPWLKIFLDQIHCVQKVIRYRSGGITYQTWYCTEDDCSNCVGEVCDQYKLRVSEEREELDLLPISDCKYGDTIKLEKVGGSQSDGFKVPEIAIVGWQGGFSFRVLLDQVNTGFGDLSRIKTKFIAVPSSFY